VLGGWEEGAPTRWGCCCVTRWNCACGGVAKPAPTWSCGTVAGVDVGAVLCAGDDGGGCVGGCCARCCALNDASAPRAMTTAGEAALSGGETVDERGDCEESDEGDTAGTEGEDDEEGFVLVDEAESDMGSGACWELLSAAKLPE
jgi:hypothetical protein